MAVADSRRMAINVSSRRIRHARPFDRLGNDLVRAGGHPDQALYGGRLGRGLLPPAPRHVRPPDSAADVLPGRPRGRGAGRAGQRVRGGQGPVRARDRCGAAGPRGRGLHGHRHQGVRAAAPGRPHYFERTYYLGPDTGGAKAYRLLAQAMATTGRVALATCVLRGKERLVLLRPAPHGLLLHTMYFADEVRDVGEIDTGGTAPITEGELELAVRLIEELSHPEFTPAQYRDDYRRRVLALVTLKGEGKAVPLGGPEVPRIRVIDLMDALTQSLAQRAAPAVTPGAPPAPMPKKPPVKVGTRAPAATPGRLERGLTPARNDDVLNPGAGGTARRAEHGLARTPSPVSGATDDPMTLRERPHLVRGAR